MKLAIDEQVLTAYALDELPIQQRIEVKAYLAIHPDAAAEVEAIRAMAGQLTAELSAEAASFSSITKPVVEDSPMKIRRSRRVEAMLAIAASVALIGGAAVVLIRSAANQSATPSSVAIQAEAASAAATEIRRAANPNEPIQLVRPDIAKMPSQQEAQLKGSWVHPNSAPKPGEGLALSVPPPRPAGDKQTMNRELVAGDVASPASDFKSPPSFNLDPARGKSQVFGGGTTVSAGTAVMNGAPVGSGRLVTPTRPPVSKVGAGQVALDRQDPALSHAVTESPREEKAERLRYGIAAPVPRDVLNDGTRTTLAEREHNTEAYDRIVDNAFLSAEQNPLSTFSIDVDTASYSNLRRFLTQGQLPPKDAVRIEEMVNYFPYRYDGPKDGDKPFAASVEVAGCPWAPSHRVVRVAIKGKEIAPKDRPASNLVFLIDVSGSMNEPNKLPLVKESLRKLVNKLDARDRVAMVVYAGNSGLVLESTVVGGFSDKDANDLWHKKYEPMFKVPEGDGSVNYKTIPEDRARAMYVEEVTQLKQQNGGRQKILDAIDRLEAGGSTNGGAGIELAYLTAQSGFIKDGINRVILATDGDFNVGVTDQGSLTRLIEEKAKGGTFLSVLGFGMGNTKDSTMEKLADKGNGNYAYIDTAKEAQKVLVEQMSVTLVTIAKDVKIQVEFNPAKVGSYRLIGYENRILAKEDFNDDKKDAGEIGAGHTVTALYEVTPLSELTARPAVDPLKYQAKPEEARKLASNELLTLKIRYKAPDAPLEQGTSKLLEFPIVDEGKGYEKASEDFKFAAAVASFGMILRGSEYKGTSNYDAAIEMAMEGKGLDANGYRAELIELIKKAKAISNQ